ncbi:MAG TPA: response regulator transcription factor [Flavisolibacter sp.]|jgi:DNA-binding NarL/FixJ family response regulator|nr:response regulator transcription factor [Flavisolibacter sp.]
MNGAVRLVIVDDHAMMRETWKMILEKHPQITVIDTCSSGAEAIECAAFKQPDIMLMDINMEPINGFDATRIISENQPDVKIIGLSINNQPTYARNLMQLGAKGYVTKNSSPDELHKAIFAVMEGGTYVCNDVARQLPPSEK